MKTFPLYSSASWSFLAVMSATVVICFALADHRFGPSVAAFAPQIPIRVNSRAGINNLCCGVGNNDSRRVRCAIRGFAGQQVKGRELSLAAGASSEDGDGSAAGFDEEVLHPIIERYVDKVMRTLNESEDSMESNTILSAMKNAFTDSTTDSKASTLAEKTVKLLEEMPDVEIENSDSTRGMLVGLFVMIQETYKEAKEKSNDSVLTFAKARVADQDFGITENLVHVLDTTLLMANLTETLAWHEDETIREQFMAPLLPIVQCSGTGKSRLLHWLRRESDQRDYARIVLLSNQKEAKVENEDSYDKLYAVGKHTTSDKGSLAKERTNLWELVKKLCADILAEVDATDEFYGRCILIFDEAQHLTAENGFLLRVLRSMTREKSFKVNNKLCKLTVVLAGTTLSLTDGFKEKEETSRSSRYLPEIVDYYESGEARFPPFFLLRTMGCLAGEVTEKSEKYTEYERMIRFSRPLFAMLQKKERPIPEFQIANKIVLGKGEWIKSEESCLSVLGTRVQMGSTNEALVAELVSKGYAHLTDFQEGTKDIPGRSSFAFLPDPVCARLAMCLMDDGFSLEGQVGGRIEGASKKQVVEMFGRIFSSGLCLPEKGNYGEVAVALYLLLCGDVLRKEANQMIEEDGSKRYHKLSVDFGRWMNIVEHGGKESKEGNGCSQDQTNKEDEDKQKANRTFQLNCIQFFRNPLRFPLKTLATDEFLKPLYEKGCAIYCATNTEAVDLVIPLKKKTENAINTETEDPDRENEDMKPQSEKSSENKYFPVFVSVKNYGYMSPKDASVKLVDALSKLREDGVTAGVLLFVIAGQDRVRLSWEEGFQNNTKSYLSGKNKEAVDAKLSEVHEKLVARIVLVHKDDFGIHDALLAGSMQIKQQTSEVYQYHSELLRTNLDAEVLVNSTKYFRSPVQEFFDKTMNCIIKHVTTQEHDGMKTKTNNDGVDATDTSE